MPPSAYCREARRLRGRWAGRPERLHWSLQDLARRQDAAAAPAKDSRGPARAIRASQHTIRAADGPAFRPLAALPQSIPAVIADQFRMMVEARLDRTGGGPILRYSQRQALLKVAARLGIGRFEANLFIAAVQHRYAGVECAAADATGDDPPARGLGMILGCAGLVATIEGLVVLGLWWATRT